MGNFKNDLAVGKIAENEVARLLTGKGYSIKFNKSNDLKVLRQFDLLITKDGAEYMLEVKNDLMCKKTGNIAIEYRCVETSISDIYIYVIDSIGIFYSTKSQMLIMLGDSVIGRSVYGGDGGRSYMKIIKFEEFKKYSKELK